MRMLRVADVSWRSASGIIQSITMLLVLGGTVQGQVPRGHVLSSKTVATAAPTITRKSMLATEQPSPPAPVTPGAVNAFTPQPLLVPQVPLSAGQSLLNYPVFNQPQMAYSQPSYGAMPGAMSGAMPYYGSPVSPAAFYGPPQPPPGIPSDPMMDPSMAGQQMPGPMMPSGEPMPGYDYEMGMGMDGGQMCPYCGGGGCGYCGGHGDGFFAGFFSCLKPYAEGGRCAPRWYDISVDGLHWTRDQVSEFVPFSAFTRFGPIILSSDSLDYDRQPGMRFSSMIQLMPGISLDFTYFGMFSWTADASISSPVGDELFSPYSQFGALVGVGQPFDESDQAQFHSLRSSTEIENFELGIKKWRTGPNCRFQGSFRAGARYIYLVDDLNFFTLGRNVPVGLGVAPAGRSSTDVRVHNSLIGFQSGFDLWTTLIPGISLGSDFKAGIYGNHAKQNTRVFGSTTAGGTSADVSETADNNDVAVVGEGNVMMIWKVNPNFTIRGGYTALYLDGVALAPENFNATNPFNNARTVNELDDNGYVFYHGGFAGFEWMW